MGKSNRMKTSQSSRRLISNSLINDILRMQKKMQLKSDIKFGQGKKPISFVMASKILSSRWRRK